MTSAVVTRCCPLCGRDGGGDTVRVQLGALAVEHSPPSAYWNGRRIAFTPRQVEILHLLARRGSASFAAIEAASGSEISAKSAAVYVCQIRARLAAAGASITIRNEPGWGYVLETGA